MGALSSRPEPTPARVPGSAPDPPDPRLAVIERDVRDAELNTAAAFAHVDEALQRFECDIEELRRGLSALAARHAVCEEACRELRTRAPDASEARDAASA